MADIQTAQGVPQDAQTGAVQQAAPQDPRQSILSMDEYFVSGSYIQDTKDFSAYAARRTGYSNLDDKQAFYPGLYVLGAISSLGKTTYVHQMADQLAAAGDAVLYFSLEQSRFELASKSLSRLSHILLPNPPIADYGHLTALEFRHYYPPAQGPGKIYPMLQPTIDRYRQAVGDRLHIVEGNFGLDVETIAAYVKTYIDLFKRTPIVIIDYLQIISPSQVNGRLMDGKTAIDHAVHALKCLQRQYNLVVLVISSLNRQNYMTPIDFESFKESGGIEYTADVLWGLQLQVIHDPAFAKEGNVKAKREAIQKAKAEYPRHVELVCLKNRYGASGYTCQYDYYPAYDYFECV